MVDYQKPFKIETLKLDIARTHELMEVSGKYLMARTDGVLDGIILEVADPQGKPCDSLEGEWFSGLPVPYEFTKIWVTNTEQAGKTLKVFIGREEGVIPAPDAAESAKYKMSSISTDKDTHFTEAITQNEMETETLDGLSKSNIKITGIALQADQQLDFRVIFWGSSSYADTDLDTDSFSGECRLDMPTYGFRIANTGQYYIHITGLDIDYIDEGGSKQLHLSLQNLSMTSKTAGSGGEVQMKIFYEERL
jgi:hypothetical protein